MTGIKHIPLFFLFICCGLHGFTQQTDTIELRVDPLNALSLPASEVISEVNYIPLQTTKESLFGTINQLAVTDKYFVIGDDYTNSILIFYRNGNFHTKIKLDAYSKPSFVINSEKEELTLTGNRWCYNLDGKKLSQEPRTFTGNFHFLQNNTIAYADYRVSAKNLPDTTNYELYLVRGGKISSSFLPYNMQHAPIEGFDWISNQHRPFYETGTDTTVWYCRPYDYKIYQLGINGLTVPYRFIFPIANTLTPDFYNDPSLPRGQKHLFFSKHMEQISGISYIYKTGNTLFFKTDSWLNSLNGGDSYFYNLESGTTVSVKSLQPDKLTGNLPLTDLGEGEEFINRNFLTTDGQYVYTCFSAAILLHMKDRQGDKIKYPTTLTSLFTSGNRKQNPVIVAIKPKAHF
jgi:hypothetical protein